MVLSVREGLGNSQMWPVYKEGGASSVLPEEWKPASGVQWMKGMGA